MKLGYLQKQMLGFLQRIQHSHTKHSGDTQKVGSHLSRKYTDKRVATSLEKRGLITVDRRYECWLIRVTDKGLKQYAEE